MGSPTSSSEEGSGDTVPVKAVTSTPKEDSGGKKKAAAKTQPGLGGKAKPAAPAGPGAPVDPQFLSVLDKIDAFEARKQAEEDAARPSRPAELDPTASGVIASQGNAAASGQAKAKHRPAQAKTLRGVDKVEVAAQVLAPPSEATPSAGSEGSEEGEPLEGEPFKKLPTASPKVPTLVNEAVPPLAEVGPDSPDDAAADDTESLAPQVHDPRAEPAAPVPGLEDRSRWVWAAVAGAAVVAAFFAFGECSDPGETSGPVAATSPTTSPGLPTAGTSIATADRSAGASAAIAPSSLPDPSESAIPAAPSSSGPVVAPAPQPPASSPSATTAASVRSATPPQPQPQVVPPPTPRPSSSLPFRFEDEAP